MNIKILGAIAAVALLAACSDQKQSTMATVAPEQQPKPVRIVHDGYRMHSPPPGETSTPCLGLDPITGKPVSPDRNRENYWCTPANPSAHQAVAGATFAPATGYTTSNLGTNAARQVYEVLDPRVTRLEQKAGIGATASTSTSTPAPATSIAPTTQPARSAITPAMLTAALQNGSDVQFHALTGVSKSDFLSAYVKLAGISRTARTVDEAISAFVNDSDVGNGEVDENGLELKGGRKLPPKTKVLTHHGMAFYNLSKPALVSDGRML